MADLGSPSTSTNSPANTAGMAAGFASYAMWGLFPIYWPLLEPAGAFEILAHRVVWSGVVMALLIVVFRRMAAFRAILGQPRTLALLTGAAVFITANWAMFIWGVNNGHVVETSLGYFINPLVTVLFGVLVLKERVRRLQTVAIAIATVAVIVLTVEYGRPPWVAFTLAFSFGVYGLLKKLAKVEAIESLGYETLIVTPFMAAFLIYLAANGQSHFGTEGAGHAILLMLSGVITAAPLLCFGAAAVRLPMVTMGLLQYVAPIMHFLLGVYWFGEDMPLGRWVGFVLVWAALVVFSYDALRSRVRHA